jgi:hypothetical protein
VGWQLVLSEEKYIPGTWILVALFVCSFSSSNSFFPLSQEEVLYLCYAPCVPLDSSKKDDHRALFNLNQEL